MFFKCFFRNFFDPKLTQPKHFFKPSVPGQVRVFRAFASLFIIHLQTSFKQIITTIATYSIGKLILYIDEDGLTPASTSSVYCNMLSAYNIPLCRQPITHTIVFCQSKERRMQFTVIFQSDLNVEVNFVHFHEIMFC